VFVVFVVQVEVMYIESVVTGIAYNVQRLYDFGLRDVMVSNLLPASCIPVYTQQYNYSKCDTAVDSLIQLHNQQLLDAVKEINSQNPGARFIILDAFAAFSQLFEQANAVGMYKNMLVFTVPPHRGAKVCLDSVANCSRFMSGLCEKVV
jgi:hypothetical protein